MSTYIVGKDGTLFPFQCNQVPNLVEIMDSLRLGKMADELKRISFYGFQCEGGEDRDKHVGNQGFISFQPLGILIVENPPEGAEAFYVWGKAISACPGTGQPQVSEEVPGYICGRINPCHGRGVLYFTPAQIGLDEIMRVTGE